MTRYFFHVHDGEQFDDLQGTVLQDLEAAKEEASRFAAALLRDHPEKFWNASEWTITIAEADSVTVAELRFTGTFAVSPANG